jgi:hypothetical protein
VDDTSASARMPKVVLAAELLDETTLEDPATLHKQTAIDRFG